MLGWYLDEIIVFLYRVLVRRIREKRSRGWPSAHGKVVTSESQDVFYPVAEVIYTYTADGKRYSGAHRRGFLFRNSAKEYADRFVPESELIVRYKPDQPTESVVWDKDQVK